MFAEEEQCDRVAAGGGSLAPPQGQFSRRRQAEIDGAEVPPVAGIKHARSFMYADRKSAKQMRKRSRKA